MLVNEKLDDICDALWTISVCQHNDILPEMFYMKWDEVRNVTEHGGLHEKVYWIRTGVLKYMYICKVHFHDFVGFMKISLITVAF